jgi:hypothetical protein
MGGMVPTPSEVVEAIERLSQGAAETARGGRR